MTAILGIETSCDETAAAVVDDGCCVRSNIVASQHALHEMYRGVVPEIASRAHLERIMQVVDSALTSAAATLSDIDAIAVGNRPGLIGSLLVGVSAAKTLAWGRSKPLIGVDHIKAHLHAAALNESKVENQVSQLQTHDFPSLGLVVSGGHTSLFEMTSPTDMTLLGKTIDDAVGEAYDKGAVILNAGYPGGPKLDALARTGNPQNDRLPRSLLDRDSLDFSFSGLKTALLYKVRGQPVGRGDGARFERSAADLTDVQRADLAASFQHAAIDVLFVKVRRAFERLCEAGKRPRRVVIGGGVSANSLLRQRAAELADELQLSVQIPQMPYCLDNAAMIAGLACQYFDMAQFDNLELPAMASNVAV